MKIIPAKCPVCNANLNIDEDSKIIKCEYCKTNLIIENNKLDIQKNERKIELKTEENYNNYVNNNNLKPNENEIKNKTKNHFKLYLIIFAIVLLIANVISIKISWDYKNSLGSIAFLILGLFHIALVKQSGFSNKAFLVANIFGLIFFFASLLFSLYVYNILPEYVNKWESENITLDIDIEEATLEIKYNEPIYSESVNGYIIADNYNGKYSSYNKMKYAEGKNIKYTKIVMGDNLFYFIYFEEDNKMCYSNEKDECIEELYLIEK